MAEDFIKSLLDEGVIKLWHDYRFGHCRDLSGNGNHGTINGNCRFEGDGLRFVDNTGFVTVLHDASLNLTDATFVILKPQQRSHDLSSGAVNLWMLDKLAGGVGVGWFWYLSTNRLLLNDGTVTRWSPLTYYDDERYVASSLAAGGGTAIGYREGLSIGNFSGANTLVTSTHNLRIGNSFPGTIQSVMIINRVLTAAEHAVLLQELAELQYPTSFWSFAKFEQDVFKRDPKLISGWNLKPTGGQVADEVTTRDLTTINQMVHAPGILGEGMSGPIEGYLASGVNPYVHADFANGYSVECWCRLASVPAGDRCIQTTVGRMRLFTNTGRVFFQVYDSSAAMQEASSVGFAVRADELFHVIGTAKENGAVRIYINEVLQPIVDTMLNFNFQATGRPLVYGAQFNFFNGVNMDFYKPRIYDYELSQEEVSAKYLEGAQAVQFMTDGAYQVSPAAEGGVLHQQIGTRSSPFRAGDAAGRWKIETDTVDGQLCKVLTCTTAGIVYIPGHLFFDTTPTEAAFGTFSGWMYKTNASTLTWKFIGTDLNAAANGYAVVYAADETVVVSELGVGNVVAGGTASHSTWHQFDVTHAGDGDFDGYIDETTFGNGNDLTITTSIGMLWDMDAGDKIALNPSGIVKRLGVFPP